MSFINKKSSAKGIGKWGVMLLIFLLPVSKVIAQGKIADKIIAVVGRNGIILKSDLEAEVAQVRQQDPTHYSDTMRCELLQQMVLQKILVAQAARDSVMVNDDDVDAQLDNRIRYFIQLYGSKEKLEEASGKTIYQMKEENRDAIKDRMIAEKMQSQILDDVKITPAEVEKFYKNIPTDSLPFFPASVEVGEVVIDPPVSPEMDAYARKKLEGIRNDIVKNGKSFELEAGLYSDDPGSRDNGGRYDDVTRNGGWDPAFTDAAFRLQPGEISPIVKTKFGYHIIQLIKRKGNSLDLRHILIRPDRTTSDFQKALTQLDSVRSELIAGKLSFPAAVGKYSTDDASKRTGGMIADPQTGATLIDISKLDPSMVVVLDSLKPGEYSHPQIFYNDQHDRSCRIVYLKSRTKPHKANLKDDYSKIQDVALQQKKLKKMQDWVQDKLPNYYIKIDPEYRSCNVFQSWLPYIATK